LEKLQDKVLAEFLINLWFQEGVPGSANVMEEAENDNGVHLLATVATELKRTLDKKKRNQV